MIRIKCWGCLQPLRMKKSSRLTAHWQRNITLITMQEALWQTSRRKKWLKSMRLTTRLRKCVKIPVQGVLRAEYRTEPMAAAKSVAAGFPEQSIFGYSAADQRRTYLRRGTASRWRPGASRDAEWNFLKGNVLLARGFLDDAVSYLQRAAQMDPQNFEYRATLDQINARRQYGYGGMQGGYSYQSCNSCTTCLCTYCLCSAAAGPAITRGRRTCGLTIRAHGLPSAVSVQLFR